jgi:2-dehydropantoate 2-reductase
MVSAAIVGAGAIGAWLADALDRAGWRVSILARGASLEALRVSGLQVERGGQWRRSAPAAGSAAELGTHDHVFLCVKAHALPQLAPGLQPLIGPQTSVISATNGIPWWYFDDFAGPLCNRHLQAVDPDETQVRSFPRERVVGSVVHASVRVLAPARVQLVAADRVIIGAPDGSSNSRVDEVTRGLCAGGINAVASERIRQEIWAKLWGNMNMNSLSALTGSGTSGLLGDPDIRELCMRMMHEMRECGVLLGLAGSMSAAERMAVTERLGDFKTSMLADLEAGRALEIEPQLGAVVEIADQLGVAAPFCHAILGLTRLRAASATAARLRGL